MSRVGFQASHWVRVYREDLLGDFRKRLLAYWMTASESVAYPNNEAVGL